MVPRVSSRTEEFGYLLDHRESWLSFVDDVYETDKQGRLTANGFLMCVTTSYFHEFVKRRGLPAVLEKAHHHDRRRSRPSCDQARSSQDTADASLNTVLMSLVVVGLWPCAQAPTGGGASAPADSRPGSAGHGPPHHHGTGLPEGGGGVRQVRRTAVISDICWLAWHERFFGEGASSLVREVLGAVISATDWSFCCIISTRREARDRSITLLLRCRVWLQAGCRMPEELHGPHDEEGGGSWRHPAVRVSRTADCY